jgi:hypothetical protein
VWIFRVQDLPWENRLFVASSEATAEERAWYRDDVSLQGVPKQGELGTAGEAWEFRLRSFGGFLTGFDKLLIG